MTRKEILKAAAAIPGWMEESELAWLIEQAHTRRRVVEIGSWKGRSMKALALSVLGTAYSVDNWMEVLPTDPRRKRDLDVVEVVEKGSAALRAEFFRNLAPEIGSGKCVPLGVESVSGPPLLKRRLDGCKVDMIFIDGDHEYVSVKQDIQIWRPLLEEGGLLCGHDYQWRGVYTAVAELLPNHRFLHDTKIWYSSGA